MYLSCLLKCQEIAVTAEEIWKVSRVFLLCRPYGIYFYGNCRLLGITVTIDSAVFIFLVYICHINVVTIMTCLLNT